MVWATRLLFNQTIIYFQESRTPTVLYFRTILVQWVFVKWVKRFCSFPFVPPDLIYVAALRRLKVQLTLLPTLSFYLHVNEEAKECILFLRRTSLSPTTRSFANLDQNSAPKSWPHLSFEIITKLRPKSLGRNCAFSSLPTFSFDKAQRIFTPEQSAPLLFPNFIPVFWIFSRHSHLWENDFYAVGPWKLINWRAPSGLKLHCNKCSVCIVNINSKASKGINSYQILVFLCVFVPLYL